MMRGMRNVVLVVLLAACGDDGVRHTPDATVHDGPVTPDAPIDGAATPVTIQTTLDGQPIGGVHVYFQNADSSVVLATVTDASGAASAVMAPGGYVTAIDPYQPPALGRVADEIDTFVGVKPGDHLHLAQRVSSTAINFTVTVQADPAATSYGAFTPCGSTSLTSAGSGAAPTGTIALYNCGADTDFLVVTYDQAGAPLDFFFVPSVAVADQQPLDLTAQTYAAVSTRTYSWTNPGTVSGFSFADTLRTGGGSILTFNGYNNVDATSGSYPVPAFTGAADLMVTTVNETRDQQYFVDWGPYSPAYTTDVGARMLVPLESSPAFDPATHTFSFTEGTTGVAPDFVYASVNAFRSADARSWTWRIASPQATSIVYPQLPTDVYDFNITAADQPGSFELAFGKVPGGYDAVRPFLLWNPSSPQPEDLMTGTTGSATLERYALLARGAQRKGDTMGAHAPRSTARVLSHRVR